MTSFGDFILFLGSVALRWLRIKKSKRSRQGDTFAPCLEGKEPDELSWVEIKIGRDRRSMPLTRCEAAVRKATS